MQRHGWTLLFHDCLIEQLHKLRRAVQRAQRSDPAGFASNANAKLFHALSRLMLEVIPQDPSRDEYRQGSTLGPRHLHWRRVSPHFSPGPRSASRPGVRSARSGPKSVAAATVEARDDAGGRLGATRRAALSGRQAASNRLPDAPYRAARLSYPDGPTAPRRPSPRREMRAGIGRRFRLFFRYDARAKVIVYAWVNDRSTLRSSGSRSDPYTVFARMLARGQPPDDWASLMNASRQDWQAGK